MVALGYAALVGMGIILGTLGAGGSILTIPILVYLLDVPIVVATSYSLALVGSTAGVAALCYRKAILFKKAAPFMVPSVLGMCVGRSVIVPYLRANLDAQAVDSALIALLLVLIALSGYFMVAKPKLSTSTDSDKNQVVKVACIGLSLGAVMGLLGSGGGFLIIPTLVLIMGFKMQQAVPTSLLIVTVNSLLGFVSDRYPFARTDWMSLAWYLIPAISGMIVGFVIARFISGEPMKRAFGYFVWAVGAAILTKEFVL